MTNLTWRELEDFIKNMDYKDIDKSVIIYDMKTDDEIQCDVIQIATESSEKEWDTYIGINLEEIETD